MQLKADVTSLQADVKASCERAETAEGAVCALSPALDYAKSRTAALETAVAAKPTARR